MKLVDRLLEKDAKKELWQYHYPQSGNHTASNWLEVKVVQVFNSGHMLCYLGDRWRDRLAKMEQTILGLWDQQSSVNW